MVLVQTIIFDASTLALIRRMKNLGAVSTVQIHKRTELRFGFEDHIEKIAIKSLFGAISQT